MEANKDMKGVGKKRKVRDKKVLDKIRRINK